jgi:hypothetical protein
VLDGDLHKGRSKRDGTPHFIHLVPSLGGKICQLSAKGGRWHARYLLAHGLEVGRVLRDDEVDEITDDKSWIRGREKVL